MSDWRRYCRNKEEFEVTDNVVLVKTQENRSHRVQVKESAEAFELSAVVVRRIEAHAIRDPELRAWRRNRSTVFVGFRVDDRGRVVGRALVPKAGLDSSEFLFYLRRIAIECDLLEYHLTGMDLE